MKALKSVFGGALLMMLPIAWPGSLGLQADELQEMQEPQEAKIYPALREPGVDEGEIRDMTIQSAILAAYFDDDAIDDDRVLVRVDEGVVHLSGNVPNDAAHERAERIASDTKNVVSVVNDLQID